LAARGQDVSLRRAIEVERRCRPTRATPLLCVRIRRVRLAARQRQLFHQLVFERVVSRQHKAAIAEPAATERRAAPLFDDVDGDSDAFVELVALEISREVRDETGQMLRAVAIGDDDGQPLLVTQIIDAAKAGRACRLGADRSDDEMSGDNR
jgi:hypothetical protein